MVELALHCMDEIKDDRHLLGLLSDNVLVILVLDDQGQRAPGMADSMERAVSQLRIREFRDSWCVRTNIFSIHDMQSAKQAIGCVTKSRVSTLAKDKQVSSLVDTVTRCNSQHEVAVASVQAIVEAKTAIDPVQ